MLGHPGTPRPAVGPPGRQVCPRRGSSDQTRNPGTGSSGPCLPQGELLPHAHHFPGRPAPPAGGSPRAGPGAPPAVGLERAAHSACPRLCLVQTPGREAAFLPQRACSPGPSLCSEARARGGGAGWHSSAHTARQVGELGSGTDVPNQPAAWTQIGTRLFYCICKCKVSV